MFYPDIISDHLFEFSKSQAKMGHQVDVITWNKNEDTAHVHVAENFTIYRLPGLNFSFGKEILDYPYLPSLPFTIEKLKPEIVHAESHLFLPTLQAIRKAKKMRIPTVVTVRGVLAERCKLVNMAQLVYLRTIGCWIFRNADKVICLTKSDAAEITKFGCPAKKITVIPNGIDSGRFRPEKIRQENLIVWVGRFVPEKGLSCLVEAARIVATEFKPPRFVLIGEGPEKEKILRLAENQNLLNKSVFLPGKLAPDQVARILGKASISVLPSLKEGLPKSLLEAMASEAAIVASNIVGVKEIITDNYNGLLVSPGNPIDLAKKIITLLRNRQLRTYIAHNARNSVSSRFEWQSVLTRTDDLYHDLL